jgi:hypothetical protein
VSFFDTSLRRESNCPVHFVWDGNGLGRPVVRIGFLLLLVAGGALSAGLMLHAPAVTGVGRVVAVVALATWGLGQVLTKLRVSRGP